VALTFQRSANQKPSERLASRVFNPQHHTEIRVGTPGTGSLENPAAFEIFETNNWLVAHRMDSALPGYLMVSSKTFTNSLSNLSVEALAEVGPILATVQRTLREVLKAQRVYIGRYGHAAGYSFHFHLIPIYDWVETLSGMMSDIVRWRLLPTVLVLRRRMEQN
jgi:diadenosine tetraphosphate (Ap4A) HIT family hydrolase